VSAWPADGRHFLSARRSSVSVASRYNPAFVSRFLVPLACAVLAVGTLPYFQHRWVADESWNCVPALTLVRTGELRDPAMPASDPESRVDTRPPLMPLSLAASFRLFGVSVGVARSGPLVAALLTLFVTYGIGRQLGGPLAGGLAAVLLAADNFFVLAARTARPEAWVTLFGCCALYFLLRSRSWPSALAAGFCVALSCLFHVLGAGWLVGMALVLVWQERAGVLRSPRSYAYAAGVAIAVMPFALWLFVSPERIASARHTYDRDATVAVSSLLKKESLRFSDYLGIPNERLRFPVALPFRLHVAAAVGAAFAILWRRKRAVFLALALATAPHVAWLIRLPNPSARYLAIEAPLFALAVGLAVVTSMDTRWYRAALAAWAVCVVTQLAGSALFLYQARNADFPALAQRVQAALPPGHSCYVAMTLQFAVADRGCHSYERTPFAYTVDVQRPEYLVLGDRVMMHGSGIGDDLFKDLRQEAFAFVERHGQLTARIDDPYYGDLRIYRVSYDGPAAGARD
jgi:4-amino-4-deoxy-L-arabinose transferase-like glycosyltransferase